MTSQSNSRTWGDEDMLRFALLNSRGRLGTYLGALITLFASSVLVMAGGMTLEAALKNHPPIERYAAASAVVTGHQVVSVGEEHVPLGERARISSALAQSLAAVPGVRAAIPDVSAPVWLGRHAAVAHGWQSAALTPYRLTDGRPPAGPDEVVAGYPTRLGSTQSLLSNGERRTVTVVGIVHPRHAVPQQRAVFLTDVEAARLSGHPGQADAIGILASPGFDASSLHAASNGATILTGSARGKAEHPELEQSRTKLIAVAASFGGIALFIAVFVVASTMGLSIQQREREIALLRAVAATPGQIKRMIAWEAVLIGLLGAAAGIVPGAILGHALGKGLVDHEIAPANFLVKADAMPVAAAIAGCVIAALLAVLGAGRRASRVPPTRALGEAAIEPRLLGPGRLIGGATALVGAVPLIAVSATSNAPSAVASTAELGALFLVVAVGFLGPVVARAAAGVLTVPLGHLSPVGGFLASANLRTATRRFSSASTPLVLMVALSCTFLFSNTTEDHAVTEQRRLGMSGEVAVSDAGPGLPATALPEVRATPGVRSAVAVTPTTLGPSLGETDEAIPAAVVDGGQGGGFDPGVTKGSLAALHGNAIALGRHRADAVHAEVGKPVKIMLGDGTRTQATVVAIYSRDLAFGEALLSPELAAGHRSAPLLGTILVHTSDPAGVQQRLQRLATRYPGMQVDSRASISTSRDADREGNRWLWPLFVLLIFGFTSIAVANTLIMIALQRGRELALLQLVGGTRRQVRSMARWEAALIVTIGVGLGLTIAAVALLPLSHVLTGSILPYVPLGELAAIIGASALLAVLALALPTRRMLHARPVEAIGIRE